MLEDEVGQMLRRARFLMERRGDGTRILGGNRFLWVLHGENSI